MRRLSKNTVLALLIVPALAFLAVFFAYPMIDILIRSVTLPNGQLTAKHYLHVVQHPIYLQVFWITFGISFWVTLFSLLIGYPLAYVIATASARRGAILMALVMIPFFTDHLVRSYAWMVLLGKNGVLNHLLTTLGMPPVALLYNRTAVIIGMTYILLPYMVITLFGVMKGIDRTLLQASQNLGASDWQGFFHVFFPLSLPGVAGGALLVFILSLGFFVVPQLLGGARDQMIAMVIQNQVEMAMNWHFASALAVILIVLTGIGFLLYERLLGLRSLFESKI